MTYLESGLLFIKKNTSRPLTRYQECINAASVEICLQNPAALVNRAALISSAREKIIKEGFVFAKEKSRSKLPVKPRRQYLSEELRTSRLKYLDEVIKNHEEKISFKEQQISSCLSVSNYAGCEELKNSIIDIRQYELGHEKKKLQNSIVRPGGIN